MKMFSNKPQKDWSSHACDAMRYLALGITELPKNKFTAQKLAVNDYTIHGE
jgi:hypothetical protein